MSGLCKLELSRETLRLWLMEAGLWQSRQQRDKAVHQPRNRRECLGELVQIYGSEHAWFEGRGPKCTLLVYVDDATGRLMELRLVDSETTFDYFHATATSTRSSGSTRAAPPAVAVSRSSVAPCTS